MTLRGQFFTNM